MKINYENPFSRRNFLKNLGVGTLGSATIGNGIFTPGKADASILSQPNGDHIPPPPDHIIRSLPENSVWGYFGADVPPIQQRINDGDVVAIQTVGTSGVPDENPESFFEKHNLPVNQLAEEIIAIKKNVKPDPSGISGHMLTGPVYINGAETGDTLEIRIHNVELRGNYGVNTTRPGSGGLPDEVEKEERHFYYFDFEKGVASPMEGIEIPLNPFMGVMALSPAPETGRVSSIPPGNFGGNLDLKHLIKGTTLYLPVSVPGGMFTTGDAHATQGNGEVSVTAIETSMTLTAEFIVHKNETIEVPRAETKDHFIAIGLDPDLNLAMKNAIRETIQMIREKMNVSYNRAFSIASTAVDFEVTQVVDRTEGIHAMIPKHIFTNQNFEYWYA